VSKEKENNTEGYLFDTEFNDESNSTKWHNKLLNKINERFKNILTSYSIKRIKSSILYVENKIIEDISIDRFSKKGKVLYPKIKFTFSKDSMKYGLCLEKISQKLMEEKDFKFSPTKYIENYLDKIITFLNDGYTLLVSVGEKKNIKEKKFQKIVRSDLEKEIKNIIENEERTEFFLFKELSKNEILQDQDKAFKTFAEEIDNIYEKLLSKITEEYYKDVQEYYNKGTEMKSDKSTEMIKNFDEVIKSCKQIVFYGPPGTGKTYLAREIAKSIGKETVKSLANLISGDKENESNLSAFYKLVVFHPSYEYEHFIRGLRPFAENGGINFKVIEGHFLQICWKALFCSYHNLKNNKEKNISIDDVVSNTQKNDRYFVLIIDEINRGNIPNIFGELIYGLEKDKRGTKIELTYPMPAIDEMEKILVELKVTAGLSFEKNDIEEFYNLFVVEPYTIRIPHNILIIGTMNTSDRSIGTIDAAIRRRFAFKYIGPDETKVVDEFKDVFLWINNLFRDNENSEIRVGGVGHSYFMGDDKEIEYKIEYYLIPLLREYYELGIAGEKSEDLHKILSEWDKLSETKDIKERFKIQQVI